MSDRPSLPPMAVAERAPRLRELMGANGCDAMLVSHLTNIRYLTGFTGSAAMLLTLPDALLFVTDGRYGDQAADQLATAGVAATIEVALSGEAQQAVLSAAAAEVERLGLESEHVSWAQQREFSEQWFAGSDLVPTAGLVETLREVKDDGEIARLELACDVADQALAAVRRRLLERPTEREFALELDSTMRALGADDVSFETIVASGPNGARPHARPGSRVCSEGDLVVIDFGALVDGYHSDMTRTVMIGEPTDVQRRMLEVVTEAQQAGVAAVAAGVPVPDVDAACRSVIDAAGWGDQFLHATGHGVGLDIHEAPRVARSGDATLAAGHVVTVEPGVYLREHGGVRVEDSVVVTADGCRVLTHTPKLAAV